MRVIKPHRPVPLRDGRHGPSQKRPPPLFRDGAAQPSRAKKSPAMDVDGATPPPRRERSEGAAAEPAAAVVGRWYRVVYGPPRAGVTSLLTVLARASHTPLQQVPSVAEAFALDPTQPGLVIVEPAAMTLDVASTIPALGYGSAAAVVLIDADDRLLVSRGATRESLAEWRHRNAEIEARLDFLCIPRARVLNVDLATAAAELARKLGLFD